MQIAFLLFDRFTALDVVGPYDVLNHLPDATVTFVADDVAAAAAWYSELLGVEPYFRRPAEGPAAYVEFRIGDYQHELGIMDARYAPRPRPGQPGGVLAYWAVDDVQAAYERLLGLDRR